MGVAIFGAGGHGRVIADILKCSGREIAGFLDDAPAAPRIAGLPVLGTRATLSDPAFLAAHEIIVALGSNPLRRALSLSLLEAGGRLARAIHPGAIIAGDVELGQGTVAMAGVVINTGSRIGRFAIVNTGATLDHDNWLEDGAQICPGCHLAGTVRCGEDVFIGTGASVIPGITIGARAIVAAGAAVIADVAPDTLVAGVPAILKRTLAPPR